MIPASLAAAAAPVLNISIYWLCGLTFILALITCAIVTPLVRRMAFAVGVFDEPDGERRVHSQPTPRLGGIAIYVGFMLALFAMLNVALSNNFVIHHYLGTDDLAHIIGLLFGGTLMMGVGLWDDIMTMRPRHKLARAGLRRARSRSCSISSPSRALRCRTSATSTSAGWSIPFSLFWYLGMVNAINFLDGFDGLVTGVTLIASITMIVVSLWHHEYLGGDHDVRARRSRRRFPAF